MVGFGPLEPKQTNLVSKYEKFWLAEPWEGIQSHEFRLRKNIKIKICQSQRLKEK